MEQKIKRCPFCCGSSIRIQTDVSEICNSKFERIERNKTYRIFCNYCGCGTAKKQDLNEAIYEWNRREYR